LPLDLVHRACRLAVLCCELSSVAAAAEAWLLASGGETKG